MAHCGIFSLKKRGGILCEVLLWWAVIVRADFPAYPTNPFVFEIPEPPYGDGKWWPGWGDDFFVADLDGDGLPDYLFRSKTKLYAYGHNGTPLGGAFPLSIQAPVCNGGAKFGVADVDGDGQMEIVTIHASDTAYPLYVYSATGTLKKKWAVPNLLSNQRVGHLVTANLQGRGDREVIVQTVDISLEGTIEYYLNRSVIAMDLSTGQVLWRHDQNRQYPPYYEGYWGMAHGPLMVADVDFDGRDEVIGGCFIDHDGTAHPLSYQNSAGWVSHSATYVDHLDAIAVGDFIPSAKGLEWIVLEEDDVGFQSYHTVLFSWQSMGVVWKKMATTLWKLRPDFTNETDYRDLEPQNVAVGRFHTGSVPYVWNRSRMGRYSTPTISQHPWVYDISGNLVTHYRMADVLPQGFNPIDPRNNEGLEMIWTIDWEGGEKEYIAGKARHAKGNVGIFDAMTGQAVWHTGTDPGADYGPVRAFLIYVADVAGDPREELIVCDSTASSYRILVFSNPAENTNRPRQTRWDDPLYRRLKQNWNYYSPGGYTRPAPVRLRVRAFLEGPYVASSGTMRTSLHNVPGHGNVIPLQSPYHADPVRVSEIPPDAVDWVLIQMRKDPTGPAVISQSAFLRNDGWVLDLHGSEGLTFHVFRGRYYVILKHRNHLGVMSATPVRVASDSTSHYDFTDSITKYYGGIAAAIRLSDGAWGLVTGDANFDGQIKVEDKNDYWWVQVGRAGYWSADFTLDGQVKVEDKNDYWWKNVGRGTQIP